MPATQYTDSLEPFLPGCDPIPVNMNTLDTYDVTMNNGQTMVMTKNCLVKNYLENASGHFVESYKYLPDFDHVVRRVARMVDNNEHGGAYVECCTLLVGKGAEDIREKLILINYKHQSMGYLSGDLSSERYTLYQKMLKCAEKQLTTEQYDRLYGSL